MIEDKKVIAELSAVIAEQKKTIEKQNATIAQLHELNDRAWTMYLDVSDRLKDYERMESCKMVTKL